MLIDDCGGGPLVLVDMIVKVAIKVAKKTFRVPLSIPILACAFLMLVSVTLALTLFVGISNLLQYRGKKMDTFIPFDTVCLVCNQR
jgi:hypothetical protein